MRKRTQLFITFISLVTIFAVGCYCYYEVQKIKCNEAIDARLSTETDYHFEKSQVFESPLQVEKYKENIIFKGLDESILMYDGENIEVLFKLDEANQIKIINDFSLKEGILYIRHSDDQLVVVDIESRRSMKKTYQAKMPLACLGGQLLYEISHESALYTNASQSTQIRDEECYKLEVSKKEKMFTLSKPYYKYQTNNGKVAIIKGSPSFSIVPDTELYYNEQMIDENVTEFTINNDTLYYLVVEPYLLEVEENSTYVPLYYLTKWDTQTRKRIVDKPVLFYSFDGNNLIYSLTGLDEENQGIYLQTPLATTKIYEGVGSLFQSTHYGMLAIIADNQQTHLALYHEEEWTILQTSELKNTFSRYTTIR